MKVKHIKCPSCGASLDYNYKQHSYKCEYCDSLFVDENDDKTHNPRVELTPDELKRVSAPITNNSGKSAKIAVVIVAFVIMFFILPFIFQAIIIDSFFDSFNNFDTNFH